MTTPNTPQFTEFKAKRQGWVEWLSGKDRSSIRNQITRMIWDAAVFRAINEARRLAPKDSEGGVQLNGMTQDLINRGFFIAQANAVRRLTEASSAAGDKGVYSLYGLLGDMEKNAGLITRENIFAVEGLEYDYERVRQAFLDYSWQQDRTGNLGNGVPEHLDWEGLKERHQDIDRLSGVPKCQRSPNDSLRPGCFKRLKSKLGVCGGLRTYVNKFIAHAATPGSRALVNADDLTITLAHLWEAHEAICKVANFVGLYLLPEAGGYFLAIPQFNQFKYMDRPLVTKQNIPKLAELWRQYDRQTRDWTSYGLGELEAEMAKGQRP